MKKYIFCLIILTCSIYPVFSKSTKPGQLTFYKPDNKNIAYVGRIDFSDKYKPKFWSAGVYIQVKFKGPYLKVYLNDEVLWGNSHNYIEISIDNDITYRIKLTGKYNKIKIGGHLSNGVHTVTICKDTESGIGYLQFLGVKCAELLPVHKKHRKIEFIGDSITTGTGSDQSVLKCGDGQWYDQHNAYMSYGPTTARALKAQWFLTAVAGIGMIHSCCNMGVTMPEVFDKLCLRSDSIAWDFNRYTPDVVTICLGQNDGKQDSVAFCSAYVNFIKTIRSHYPKADIVCLTSPMGNAQLTALLKKDIAAIQQYFNNMGDKKVAHYYFSRSFNDGCGGHPSMAQHQLIAAELTDYLRGLKGW